MVAIPRPASCQNREGRRGTCLPSSVGSPDEARQKSADRHGAFELATAQIRLSVVWKYYDSPKAMFRDCCFVLHAIRETGTRGSRSCRRGCVPFVSSTHRVIVKDRASASRSLFQDSGRKCERRVAESVACMDSCMWEGMWRTRPYYVTT